MTGVCYPGVTRSGLASFPGAHRTKVRGSLSRYSNGLSSFARNAAHARAQDRLSGVHAATWCWGCGRTLPTRSATCPYCGTRLRHPEIAFAGAAGYGADGAGADQPQYVLQRTKLPVLAPTLPARPRPIMAHPGARRVGASWRPWRGC
jgi:hypothetical protein